MKIDRRHHSLWNLGLRTKIRMSCCVYSNTEILHYNDFWVCLLLDKSAVPYRSVESLRSNPQRLPKRERSRSFDHLRRRTFNCAVSARFVFLHSVLTITYTLEPSRAFPFRHEALDMRHLEGWLPNLANTCVS